jgi:hypothetical protein
MARSSDEGLLIRPSHDNADRLRGLAQLPSTKYRPPYTGGRPASALPQFVLPGKNRQEPGA